MDGQTVHMTNGLPIIYLVFMGLFGATVLRASFNTERGDDDRKNNERYIRGRDFCYTLDHVNCCKSVSRLHSAQGQNKIYKHGYYE